MITASLQYLGGTSRVGTSPVDVIAKWEFVLFYLFICSGFTRDRTYFYTRLCGASGGGARMPKKSNDQQWLIYSWIFFFYFPRAFAAWAAAEICLSCPDDRCHFWRVFGIKKKKKDRHKTQHQIGRTAVPITVDNICRLTAEGELL